MTCRCGRETGEGKRYCSHRCEIADVTERWREIQKYKAVLSKTDAASRSENP